MSSYNLFERKEPTNYSFTNNTHTHTHTHTQNLALNKPQGLIFHITPTETI